MNSIGWGVTNPILVQRIQRHVNPFQPHKRAYDHGGLRFNTLHMQTTGFHADHLDKTLGIPYHQLDLLSVRDQRVIVT